MIAPDTCPYCGGPYRLVTTQGPAHVVMCTPTGPCAALAAHLALVNAACEASEYLDLEDVRG